MASIIEKDSKKWINASLAIFAAVVWYILHTLFVQLGDWFDLEAKVPFFNGVIQGGAGLISLTMFAVIVKNPKTSKFIDEVFGELLKVIWPDKDSVFKLTWGIIIAVSIVSMLLVLVDLGVREFLELLY